MKPKYLPLVLILSVLVGCSESTDETRQEHSANPVEPVYDGNLFICQSRDGSEQLDLVFEDKYLVTLGYRLMLKNYEHLELKRPTSKGMVSEEKYTGFYSANNARAAVNLENEVMSIDYLQGETRLIDMLCKGNVDKFKIHLLKQMKP